MERRVELTIFRPMLVRGFATTRGINRLTSRVINNGDLDRNLNIGRVAGVGLVPLYQTHELGRVHRNSTSFSTKPNPTMSEDTFSSSTSSNPDATLLSRSHHVGKASTSVISEVIPNAGYPAKWPYFPDDFKRMDENDDGFFYMTVRGERASRANGIMKT
jgi:hypothetical protein